MKGLGRILLYTLWWGVAGLTVGWGLSSWFQLEWIFSCMWLNIVAGLMMLVLILQNPELDALFTRGPQRDRPGSILIAILWALPFVMILAGLFWWAIGQLSR